MSLNSSKKSISRLLISFFILSFTLITACGGNGSEGGSSSIVAGSSPIVYVADSKFNTFSGSATDDAVYKVETTGNTELTYQLNLGSNTKTVYYIFTNTNLSADTTPPYYVANVLDEDDEDFSLERPQFSESALLISDNISMPFERGKPEITEFNRNPWYYLSENNNQGFENERNYSISSLIKDPSKAMNYSAGATNNFIYDSNSPLIPATCQSVVTDGTKTLVIWVADDCWYTSSSTKPRKITSAMVTAMANKFMQTSGGNDVYHWVTNIYGEEWGTHPSNPELIPPDNTIHILLYDIDDDNSTNGGVLGFFWAKDNFYKTGSGSIPSSNERIMFYLDAVMYAAYAASPATWSLSDTMPSLIISTLAHEFQHMINFYQKNVVDGAPDSDTWVNEMCSLVTEDLVADKLGVNGPRGVAYGTGTAGSGGNTEGRLPLFNYAIDSPLTTWLAAPKTLRSYSVSYAFGSYLARNYGGAALFRDIVSGVSGKSVYGDYRDIVEAVKAHGGAADVTMSDLLRDWGAAVVLSNKTSLVSTGKYKYNGTGFFTSTIDSTFTFNLGAINLFNYSYSYVTPSLNEPWCWSTTGLNSSVTNISKGSNLYVKESSVSGLRTKKFRMRDGVKLTVIVK